MAKRRDVYAQVAALRAKHGADRSLVRTFPDLSVAPGPPSLSNGFAPVVDNRPKRLGDKFRHEARETRRAIEAKAARVRPHYGKGPYQYASDGDSPVGIYAK